MTAVPRERAGNLEAWLRRIRSDLASYAPEDVRHQAKAPAGSGPAPEPEVLGYVAVTRRERGLLLISSVTPYREQAQTEADKWTADDVHGAFVAELREVTR